VAAPAGGGGDAVQFRRRLGEWVSRSESAQGDAGEQIRLLIDYDGREVDELSTGERMPVRTLTLLWQFLTGCLENVEMRTDLFIDLFYLFKRLGGAELPPLSMQRVRIRSERWPSGLDAEVREIRADNRERMLHLLVQKIENRKSTPSRFRFAEGMSYEDKYRQVAIWWNDFRFHLAMAVKSPSELNRFLGNSLSAETMYLLSKARKKGMPFFATPYYLSLLDVTGKGYGDEAIRADACAYFLTFALMVPFSQLNSLCASFLQSAGDMVSPSVLNAVMCVLDVFFNALFIPRCGVFGAGLGTASACAVVSLLMAAQCLLRNSHLHMRRHEKDAVHSAILKKAFRIGFPVALQEVFLCAAMVVQTRIIAPLGAVAASGFSMSRGKAQELISSGRVQLNYRETLKSDAPVAQGDVISARGLGKFEVAEVGGLSKKGRTALLLHRYL